MAPELKYFNHRRLFAELRDAWFAERGFLFTAYRCLLSFGDAMRIVLAGDGDRLGYNSPLKFLTVSVALTAMASHFYAGAINDFQALDASPPPALVPSIEALEQIASEQNQPAEINSRIRRAVAELSISGAQQFQNEINKWLNVALLMAVPVIAAGTWVFFRRSYNLVEHMVITSYLYSIQCLLWFACLPFLPWLPTVTALFYFISSGIYQLVAWRSIFGFKTWKDWTLAIVALLLTYVAYCVVVMLLMILVFAYSFAQA